jgi:hypothetical protein
MNEPVQPTVPARRSRRLLVITLAVVILLAAVIAARQLVSRQARTQVPVEDCEKEPPPESFTLADCDAGQAPSSKPDKPEPQKR